MRITKCCLISSVLLSLATFLSFAQSVDAGAGTEISEAIEVKLHKLVVRVLDGEGNPVGGLEPSRFSLSNQGKAVPIENFESFNVPIAEDEASHSEDLVPEDVQDEDGVIKRREHYTLILLDTAMMTEKGFEKLKEGLKSYLERQEPGVRQWALGHYEHGFQFVQHFTTDPSHLIKAVDRVKFEGHYRQRLEILQDSINKEYLEMSQHKAGAGALIPILTRQKKTAKDQHFYGYYYGLTAAREVLSRLPGDRSLVMVGGGNYPNEQNQYLLRELMARFNGSNITINGLLIREKDIGGSPSTPQSLAYNHTGRTWRGGNRYANGTLEYDYQSYTGFEDCADGTGGILVNTNKLDDLEEAFGELDSQARQAYVLWYRSSHKKQDLKVTLSEKPKKWRLVYGKRDWPATPYHELTGVARQMALYSTLEYAVDTEGENLPVQWNYHLFPGLKPRVGFSGVLDASRAGAGSYEIAAAILDHERQSLSMTHRYVTVPVALFSFSDAMQIQYGKGRYLSLSMRNMENGALYQRVFPLPDVTSSKVAGLSSVVLVQEGSRIVPQFLGELSNPYQVQDRTLPVALSDRFKEGTGVGAYVTLENSGIGSNWESRAGLMGEGVDYPVRRLLYAPIGEDRLGMYFTLESDGLKPGTYRFVLNMHGPSGEHLSVEKALIIEPTGKPNP